jgi:hypothetical protein
MQARCQCISNLRKLSDVEEHIIVQHILGLDLRGFPSQLRSIEEMANQLPTDRHASPFGKR